MRSPVVRFDDFDDYDQFLLWTAVKFAHHSVSMQKGDHGYWVADLPRDEPARLDSAFGFKACLVRLVEIVGLTGSAPPPAVEPGSVAKVDRLGRLKNGRTQ